MVLGLVISAARLAVHAANSLTEQDGQPAEVVGLTRGTIVQLSRTFPSGTQYTGEWCVGSGAHGRGRMVWPSGNVYEGEFQLGKMHGRGTLVCTDGSKYVGEYQFGVKEGNGTQWYTNGQVYVGTWLKGKRNGPGTFYEGNGRLIYNGFYKDNQRHGQGELRFSNGDIYLGEFVDGQMSGRGRYLYPNGDIFDGVWLNGVRKDGVLSYAADRQGFTPAAGAASGHAHAASGVPPGPSAPMDTDVDTSAPPASDIQAGLDELDESTRLVFDACLLMPIAFSAADISTVIDVLSLDVPPDVPSVLADLASAGLLFACDSSRWAVFSEAVGAKLARSEEDANAMRAGIANMYLDRLQEFAQVLGAPNASEAPVLARLKEHIPAFSWALQFASANNAAKFCHVVHHTSHLMLLFPCSNIVRFCETACRGLGFDVEGGAPNVTTVPVVDLAAVLLQGAKALRMAEREVEAGTWLRQCLALTEGATVDDVDLYCVRIEADVTLATMQQQLDRIATALTAISAAPGHTARRLEGRLRLSYAMVVYKSGGPAKAAQIVTELVTNARSSGSQFTLGSTLPTAAFILAVSRQAGAAKPLADEAAHLARAHGFKELLIMAMLAQGSCALQLKDRSARFGATVLEECLHVAREQQNALLENVAVTLISGSLRAAGESSKAADLIRSSLIGHTSITQSIPMRHYLLSTFYTGMQRYEEAAAAADAAMASARQLFAGYGVPMPLMAEARYTFSIAETRLNVKDIPTAYNSFVHFMNLRKVWQVPVPGMPAEEAKAEASPEQELTALLATHRLAQYEAPIRELGVQKLADLADVSEANLTKIGMTPVERNRFAKLVASAAVMSSDAAAEASVPPADSAAPAATSPAAGITGSAEAAIVEDDTDAIIIGSTPLPKSFLGTGLKIVNRATEAPMEQRMAIYRSLITLAWQKKLSGTVASVCLGMATALKAVDKRAAAFAAEEGLQAVAQQPKAVSSIAGNQAVAKALRAIVTSSLQEIGPYCKPQFVSDDSRNDCTLCHSAFGLFNRRHHCRACGQLVCGDCSGSTLALPAQFGAGDAPVRVCNSCVPRFTGAGK